MRNRYQFSVNTNFLFLTKGKIIFGFAMAVFALIAAWGVSKLVFEKMIATVDGVSKPDEKLNLVNGIYNDVSRLDQKQKYLAINKSDEGGFISETRAIKLKLDTLSYLYAEDAAQLKRLASIKKLLAKRDQQFINYLTVRDSLLNTNSFSKEIENLNSIFAERAFQTDSAIYTTESKIATTTVKEEDNKGFFSKLFGKRKPDSYKIVSEELKIKRDTLNQFAEDSTLQSIENSLAKIKSRQKLKSKKFVEKERKLILASNELTQQMLAVLEEVRVEALVQVAYKGSLARTVVNQGIKQITSILIVFFILTVLMVYFILTDLSKSNRYRLALEEAKRLADYNAKAKERFLSNMSHEIRTPLQSIVGYSELIQKTKKPDKQAVNAIKLSASHLLYIINEILDYSRITSGKFTLKCEPFNVKDAINEVVLILQPLASQKNLSLMVQLSTDEGTWVKGDVFRLKQVLYNLLGNAIKFTEKGSVKLRATISKKEEATTLTIIVEDTGIGIDKKSFDSVFEEFDNGNHQETADFKSTGLGLSIVKQLVSLHHGNIEVKSEVGKGTVFSLELCYVSVTEQEVNQTLPQKKLMKKFTDKLVWVIDDDQLILDLCSLILSQNNIQHQTFNQPKQLLSQEIPENLAYVLMDMRMPEIDGLTLFGELVKRVSQNVLIYAITAQILPEEQRKILATGFHGIIKKPFTEESLLSVLAEHQPEFDELNTTNLKKMTFGDKNQLTKILTRFAEDCIADIELLKQKIIERDHNICRLITHRLAGRTGQIGYKLLSQRFRRIETKLNNKDTFNEDLVNEINEETKKLTSFIAYLVEKDYSI